MDFILSQYSQVLRVEVEENSLRLRHKMVIPQKLHLVTKVDLLDCTKLIGEFWHNSMMTFDLIFNYFSLNN